MCYKLLTDELYIIYYNNMLIDSRPNNNFVAVIIRISAAIETHFEDHQRK